MVRRWSYSSVVPSSHLTLGRLRIDDLCRNDLDWALLTRLAARHHVLPLLFRNLSSTRPGSVPTVVLDELRATYLYNAARSISLPGSCSAS